MTNPIDQSISVPASAAPTAQVATSLLTTIYNAFKRMLEWLSSCFSNRSSKPARTYIDHTAAVAENVRNQRSSISHLYIPFDDDTDSDSDGEGEEDSAPTVSGNEGAFRYEDGYDSNIIVISDSDELDEYSPMRESPTTSEESDDYVPSKVRFDLEPQIREFEIDEEDKIGTKRASGISGTRHGDVFDESIEEHPLDRSKYFENWKTKEEINSVLDDLLDAVASQFPPEDHPASPEVQNDE